MRIVVVGPCGSGKTTLVQALKGLGYDAHECVQEHSYVPSMWRQISRSDVLVYLDVSLNRLRERKPRSDWTHGILDEQACRLADARAHCSLYVQTDELVADGVLAAVLGFLSSPDSD